MRIRFPAGATRRLPLPLVPDAFPPEATAGRKTSGATHRDAGDRSPGESARNERLRLARDIHDGILQALTGVALRIETVTRLIGTDPHAAAAQCRSAGEMIAAEQSELRALIRELTASPAPASLADLRADFESLRERLARDWDLRMELTISGQGGLPSDLIGEVRSIVREGLTNVARHAQARTARVTLLLRRGTVRISIVDDGCGFPYRGRFDLAALDTRGIGPASLRGRVSALGGAMVLVTDGTGSSLTITIPTADRNDRRCA
jgi:signal transduction histidine kinase